MSSSSGRSAIYSNASSHCFGRLGERDFVDVLGVGADRVAARAEAAVDRARVERQKQRLVDVAVNEARHRRVVLLVQRVERQARMVGQQRAGERNELPPDRIVVRIVPVDRARSRTARRARPSARARKPASRVGDELRRGQTSLIVSSSSSAF